MIPAAGGGNKILLQSQPSVKSKGFARGARVGASDETPRSLLTRNSHRRGSRWGRLFGSKKKSTPPPPPVITRWQHIDNLKLLSKFVTEPDNMLFLQATGLFREVPSPTEKEIASQDLALFLEQNRGSRVSETHVLTATLIKDAFRGSMTVEERLWLALVIGIEPASLTAGISDEHRDELDALLKDVDSGAICTSSSPALKIMVAVCRAIEKFSASNKMSFHNLAVCLAPILHPKTADTEEGTRLLLTLTALMKNFFESLLRGMDTSSNRFLSPKLQSLRKAIFDSVRTLPPPPAAEWRTSLLSQYSELSSQELEPAICAEAIYAEVGEAVSSSSTESLREVPPPVYPRTVSIKEPKEPIYHSSNELGENACSNNSVSLTQAFPASPSTNASGSKIEIRPVPRPRTRTFTSAMPQANSSTSSAQMERPRPRPRPLPLPRIKSLPTLLDDESSPRVEIMLSSNDSISEILEAAVPQLGTFRKPRPRSLPKLRKKVPPPVGPRVSSLRTGTGESNSHAIKEVGAAKSEVPSSDGSQTEQ